MHKKQKDNREKRYNFKLSKSLIPLSCNARLCLLGNHKADKTTTCGALAPSGKSARVVYLGGRIKLHHRFYARRIGGEGSDRAREKRSGSWRG